MATEGYILGSDWKQFTSGSNDVVVQVFNGRVGFCESAEKPVAGAAFHILEPGIYTFTRPWVVWLRSISLAATVKVVATETDRGG